MHAMRAPRVPERSRKPVRLWIRRIAAEAIRSARLRTRTRLSGSTCSPVRAGKRPCVARLLPNLDDPCGHKLRLSLRVRIERPVRARVLGETDTRHWGTGSPSFVNVRVAEADEAILDRDPVIARLLLQKAARGTAPSRHDRRDSGDQGPATRSTDPPLPRSDRSPPAHRLAEPWQMDVRGRAESPVGEAEPHWRTDPIARSWPPERSVPETIPSSPPRPCGAARSLLGRERSGARPSQGLLGAWARTETISPILRMPQQRPQTVVRPVLAGLVQLGRWGCPALGVRVPRKVQCLEGLQFVA